MKKLLLTFTILAFSLNSCKNSQSLVENNNLVYNHNENSIELIFENSKNYVELDKPNEVRLKLKNLKCEKLSLTGKGIRITEMNDENCVLEIYPKSEYSETNEFELLISFRENNEKIEHLFKIPIKTKK